jgi:hypothetical protein
MKDQANEFLQAAQQAKEAQEILLEEAQNLVGFLRQSASANFLPASPYLHQHNFGHFQPNFCSPSPCGTSLPPYYGQTQQQQQTRQLQQAQTLRRNGNNGTSNSKIQESNIDADEGEMETLNESIIQNHANQQTSNGYFDSLGVKSRKSKSIHSNGSSSSSSAGSSNAQRASVLEPMERKPGSKSPNTEGTNKPNDGSVKVSHL